MKTNPKKVRKLCVLLFGASEAHPSSICLIKMLVWFCMGCCFRDRKLASCWGGHVTAHFSNILEQLCCTPNNLHFYDLSWGKSWETMTFPARSPGRFHHFWFDMVWSFLPKNAIHIRRKAPCPPCAAWPTDPTAACTAPVPRAAGSVPSCRRRRAAVRRRGRQRTRRGRGTELHAVGCKVKGEKNIEGQL